MPKLQPQPVAWIHSAPFQASATREIDATPAEVFAALCDHERWPEWFTTLVKVERFGDKHEGVGSNRRVFINKRMAIDEEFVAWDPNTAWGFTVLEAKVPLKSMNELVTIEDLGDGRSSVTYLMGIEAKGWFQPVVNLMKKMMSKNLGDALDNLGPWIAKERTTEGAS